MARKVLIVREFSLLLAVAVTGAAACATVQDERWVWEGVEDYFADFDPREHRVIELPDTALRVCFLDEDRLLYSSGNDLVIQGIRDSLDRVVLRGHTRYVSDFDISPDGTRIVSTSADGTVRLWDARTGEELAVSMTVDTLSQPSWYVLQDVMFSRDGKKVYTGDMNGIFTWSARDCRLLSTDASDHFYMRWGILAPDMKTCAAPVVWLTTGFEVMACGGESLYYHEGPQSILGFSPDGRTLLIADDESGNMYGVNVHSLRRKKHQVRLTPFLRRGVTTVCAAYSPDGKRIASASEDGAVYVWNAETGDLLEVFPVEKPVSYISFDREGDRILTSGMFSTRAHIHQAR